MGRRGPAPNGPYSSRKAVVTIRMQSDTRAALMGAIAKSKRALSQEIEHRLRQSFENEKNIAHAFGNKRNYAVMRMLSAAIETNLNLKKGKTADWLSDPYLFAQAEKAIAATLSHLRPNGEVPDQTEILEYGGNAQGALSAEHLIHEAQVSDPAAPIEHLSQFQHLARRLREDLSDVLERAKPYGLTAEQNRALKKIGPELTALTRKARSHPKKMTVKDRERLDELHAKYTIIIGDRQ